MRRTFLIPFLLLTLSPVRSTAQQAAPSREAVNQPSSPTQGDNGQRRSSPQEQAHQALSPALERINAAADLSTLEDPALRPWHMRIAFDLLDPAGAVREHGTVEIWWASPQRHRITITSPSYTGTRTRLDEAVYRTKGQVETPDLVDLIISQAMTPLDRVPRDDSLTALSEKKLFGKVSLDCIMPLSKKDPAPHYLGEYTTYCFEPGDPVLRSLIRYRGQFIIRNQTARFQNRELAMSLAVIDGGKILLKSEITSLTTYTPSEHDFDQAPDQEVVPPAFRVGSARMAGRLLTKVTPSYPESARRQHISGVVILRAHIGKDGHIGSLTVTRSPDKSLADSAVEAVKKWVYQPLLIDGAPTDVETTITVNFNMG